jgi:glycosyltransferase involved in cell wall biosynthesis
LNKNLSVVMPVFNEQGSVTKSVRNIERISKKVGFQIELICVNDGSTDKTTDSLNLLKNSMKKSKNFRLIVIHHAHNLGYGGALKTGINDSKFEDIGIIDCDSSYDFEQLLSLYLIYKSENLDMIVGDRSKSPNYSKLGKKILRSFLRLFVQYMTDRKIPDVNSGLRIFKKSVVKDRLFLLSDKFSFTTSITIIYMIKNLFVKYYPIDYHPRVGKSKVKLLNDSIRTLGFILSLTLYFNPLRVLAPILILTVLVSILSVYFGTILHGVLFLLLVILFVQVFFGHIKFKFSKN